MDAVIAEGFGNLSIQSTVNGTGYIIELCNILYASDMMYNLVSCTKAQSSGMKIDINDSDHDPSNRMVRLIEIRKGLTRMSEMEIKEELLKASINPYPIEYFYVRLDQSSNLLE